MPTVLITGANRGLGLEFAKQYAAEGYRIVATCRDPEEAGELAGIDGARVEVLDMTDHIALASFGERLGGVGIDLFIANAGLMEPRGPMGADYAEAWMRTLAVNAVAPVVLAYALKERIVRGGKAVAITSKMGSIADNGSGGYYAYRSSKAALNAAWRSLAFGWRKDGISAAMLHPGWVRTRMGGPNGLIDAPESVAGMRQVIDALDLDRTGAFLNYDGTPIPW
jgi:NAD(P)-dependent dehydrogenase (short-subunit alcohol dehydrogenase family)